MSSTTQRRSDFHRLIARIQGGDAEAARLLYEQFGQYLMRAVRSRLHRRLRSKFDSIDFTQDVWGSFFTRVIDKYKLTEPEELVNLLSAMARNKIVEVARTQLGRRRRPHPRETRFEESDDSEQAFASTTTPSQIAMGEEAWNRLLADQPPVYRRILLMLRDGVPDETIAAQLGLALRTVQRVIRKVVP
jgi:RNA polymerase sigma-70 factor (ECF subfamily)